MAAPFRLPPTPREQIATLADDRDFCLAIAREQLDRAERFEAEIKRIEAEQAERAAERRDRREVSALAGSRVRIAGEDPAL